VFGHCRPGDLTVRYPKVDDNNRFFKSGAIWPPRHANFLADCCKRVVPRRRFLRRSGKSTRPAGNLWQLRRRTGSNLKPTECFGAVPASSPATPPGAVQVYVRGSRLDSATHSAPESEVCWVVATRETGAVAASRNVPARRHSRERGNRLVLISQVEIVKHPPRVVAS
jgi:hypothetical protein